MPDQLLDRYLKPAGNYKSPELVWILNFMLPGLWLGYLYARGAAALPVIFFLWIVEIIWWRWELIVLAYVIMSFAGHYAVRAANMRLRAARDNQAPDAHRYDHLLSQTGRSGSEAGAGFRYPIDNLRQQLRGADEDSQAESEPEASAADAKDTGFEYALDSFQKKLKAADAQLNVEAETEEPVDSASVDTTGDGTADRPLYPPASDAGQLLKRLHDYASFNPDELKQVTFPSTAANSAEPSAPALPQALGAKDVIAVPEVGTVAPSLPLSAPEMMVVPEPQQASQLPPIVLPQAPAVPQLSANQPAQAAADPQAANCKRCGAMRNGDFNFCLNCGMTFDLQ